MQKLVVNNRGIEFTLDRENLQIIAEAIFRNHPLPEELPTSENTIGYTKLCKIEQVRHGKGFIIAGQNQRSESLVNALRQAWEWNDWIAEGKITSIQELSEKLEISRRYVNRVLNMRYLSPKIQLMILRGTQPLNWTTHTFMKALPSDWGEQEKELGL